MHLLCPALFVQPGWTLWDVAGKFASDQNAKTEVITLLDAAWTKIQATKEGSTLD